MGTQITFNFLKKQTFQKKHSQITQHLISRNYKLINTTITYSFSCKQSKKSNWPSKKNKLRPYPYKIVVHY